MLETKNMKENNLFQKKMNNEACAVEDSRVVNNFNVLQFIQNIQNKILLKKLEKKYTFLENIYFCPQILNIHGFHHLRNIPGQNWKSKVHSLFYETNLPQFWILDVQNDDDNDSPQKIKIQLISYRVKIFVKTILINYFNTVHNNNICISDP